MKILFNNLQDQISIEFNPFLISVFDEAQKIADKMDMSQIVYISGNDFAFATESYFSRLKPRPRKIAEIKPFQN